MTDVVISNIRTLSAMAAGAIVTWLIARGLSLDLSVTNGLAEVFTAVLSAAYYALVRALEARWPSFGWLLLSARKPKYAKRVTDGR